MFDETSDRHVIPIWKSATQSLLSPELLAIKPKVNPWNNVKNTDQLVGEYLANNTLPVAIDVVNTAFCEGEFDKARNAATHVFGSPQAPRHARLIANLILSGKSRDIIDDLSSVTLARKRLKATHLDSLAWADLSRHFATMGKHEKARRAMLAALTVGRNGRWITRVASRLFIHLDEFDYAHALLSRHPAVRSDPWILSAEMAAAQVAGKVSSNWKTAKSLLSHKSVPIHFSELASAMGTQELISGPLKKAKTFFELSLHSPTANSLAQAKWVERREGVALALIGANLPPVCDANEAMFWDLYNNERLEEALDYGIKWMKDEPYSAHPAVMSCYVASLLDRYSLAMNLAEDSLRANPDDVTLRLNRSFAWCAARDWSSLSEGDRDVAKEILNDILSINPSDESEHAHVLANVGLWFYRAGHADKGREFYQKSVEIFDVLKSASAMLARLNHCREAILSQAPWANELFGELRMSVTSPGQKISPGVRFYMRRLDYVASHRTQWMSEVCINYRDVPDSGRFLNSGSGLEVKRLVLPDDV